ncbi:hypothetical protein [Actinopolyspora halophila]|uniref:hypothetical protein n=1 Tax=Actinopolyspora halophila TaxID=1850 RepID=UPI0003803B8F|nr:hypothetical protein [Actinopolyspora halophila]
MRKHGIALLGATLALTGALGVPAAAGTTTEHREVGTASAAAPADKAPGCVRVTQNKGIESTKVKFTNKCKKNQRVKAIMARGRDSRCISVAPKNTRSHVSYGARPYLNKVVSC